METTCRGGRSSSRRPRSTTPSSLSRPLSSRDSCLSRSRETGAWLPDADADFGAEAAVDAEGAATQNEMVDLTGFRC